MRVENEKNPCIETLNQMCTPIEFMFIVDFSALSTFKSNTNTLHVSSVPSPLSHMHETDT